MKLFTVAGVLAGIAIVAYVAHRTYKDTARVPAGKSDARYSIDDLLAEMDV